MKTRIVHTKIWTDGKFESLSLEARYLFIYLISNQYISKTGAYQLTERVILFETELSRDQFEKARSELESRKMVQFLSDDWIVIKNACRYNNYYSGSKVKDSFDRELSELPEEVKKSVVIPVSYQYDSGQILTINHKAQIINHKSESINHKTVDTEKYREKLREKGLHV